MTFFEKSVVRRGQPCGQYALRKVPLVEIEVIATLREDSNAENRGQKTMN